MRLLVALLMTASAGLLVSGCWQYGSDPKTDMIEDDEGSTEPSDGDVSAQCH